jgi:hypothetical protein
LPHIAIVNEAKTPFALDLVAFADALQGQLNNDVAPAWNVASDVTVAVYAAVADMPAGSWLMVFLDNADAAGALAYHLEQDNGLPLMRVFVETILADKSSISESASHEGIETLIDPSCTNCYQVKNSFFSAEASDPVEDQGYEINGISMSNFVYPAWFQSISWPMGTQYDQMRLCTEPLQILKGGYQDEWVGHGWRQVTRGMRKRTTLSNRQQKRRHKALVGHLRGPQHPLSRVHS